MTLGVNSNWICLAFLKTGAKMCPKKSDIGKISKQKTFVVKRRISDVCKCSLNIDLMRLNVVGCRILV